MSKGKDSGLISPPNHTHIPSTPVCLFWQVNSRSRRRDSLACFILGSISICLQVVSIVSTMVPKGLCF